MCMSKEKGWVGGISKSAVGMMQKMMCNSYIVSNDVILLMCNSARYCYHTCLSKTHFKYLK